MALLHSAFGPDTDINPSVLLFNKDGFLALFLFRAVWIVSVPKRKFVLRNRNYSNSTELSKHIWILKDNNTKFTINWSILATAPAYSNKSKRCHLCLTEKLYLVRAKKPSLLNKRTELISKCRHENKFYLANFTSPQQYRYIYIYIYINR